MNSESEKTRVTPRRVGRYAAIGGGVLLALAAGYTAAYLSNPELAQDRQERHHSFPSTPTPIPIEHRNPTPPPEAADSSE